MFCFIFMEVLVNGLLSLCLHWCTPFIVSVLMGTNFYGFFRVQRIDLDIFKFLNLYTPIMMINDMEGMVRNFFWKLESFRRVVNWLNRAELLCLFNMGVLVCAVCSKGTRPFSLNGFGASSTKKLPRRELWLPTEKFPCAELRLQAYWSLVWAVLSQWVTKLDWGMRLIVPICPYGIVFSLWLIHGRRGFKGSNWNYFNVQPIPCWLRWSVSSLTCMVEQRLGGC